MAALCTTTPLTSWSLLVPVPVRSWRTVSTKIRLRRIGIRLLKKNPFGLVWLQERTREDDDLDDETEMDTLLHFWIKQKASNLRLDENKTVTFFNIQFSTSDLYSKS